jgi:hypothetical protein
MLLALLTEFLCSFASRLVAAVSEICKNTLQRLGNDDNKHGHLLRVSCDRHLAIFIFRVPFENSAFAANDITARDLISSGFRFSWRVGPHGLSCFRSRSSSPPRPFGCPIRLPDPATPGGISGHTAQPMLGTAIQVSANSQTHQ